MKKIPEHYVNTICPQCGKEFISYITAARIEAGRGRFCSRSCSAKANSVRHGHCTDDSQSGTYISYQSMISRCYRKSSPKYKTYGKLGISVCDNWLNSFQSFLNDMGERPEGKTLDRINSLGNYSPENCRWATKKEQQRNIKTNVYIGYNGESKCVSEWAEILGISTDVIFYRIKRGWSVEDTLTIPVKYGNRVKIT